MREFKETQRFNQWWMVLIAFIVTGLNVYALVQQLVFKKPFGNNPASDTELIVISIFVFALFGFLQFMSLRTTIDAEKIQVRFYPFKTKTIAWNQVEQAEVLNYGFVGGWGYRLWTKYGTVFNVKDKIGLAITLKDGKKYLIGTQKESELRSVLKDLKLI